MNLSIHTLGCIYNPNRDTDCLREGILSAHGTYYWLLVKQGTLRICHMGGKQDERHSGIIPCTKTADSYHLRDCQASQIKESYSH